MKPFVIMFLFVVGVMLTALGAVYFTNIYSFGDRMNESLGVATSEIAYFLMLVFGVLAIGFSFYFLGQYLSEGSSDVIKNKKR